MNLHTGKYIPLRHGNRSVAVSEFEAGLFTKGAGPLPLSQIIPGHAPRAAPLFAAVPDAPQATLAPHAMEAHAMRPLVQQMVWERFVVAKDHLYPSSEL